MVNLYWRSSGKTDDDAPRFGQAGLKITWRQQSPRQRIPNSKLIERGIGGSGCSFRAADFGRVWCCMEAAEFEAEESQLVEPL